MIESPSIIHVIILIPNLVAPKNLYERLQTLHVSKCNGVAF